MPIETESKDPKADFAVDCKSNISLTLYTLLIPPSATLITPPAPTPPAGPSQEDIRKVIAEHKAREDKKEKGDKERDKEKEKPASPKPNSAVPTPAPAPAPAASHRKFALHRQIFDMRRDDIKRKEQGVKAREVGKGEFWDRCDIWDWS
jgi:hypothetical protein